MNNADLKWRRAALAPAKSGYTGLLAGPHRFWPKAPYFWICAHCYAPWSLHPRTDWVRSRPKDDHRYLSRTTLQLNNTNARDETW